jgi:hypothetical protein
VGVNLRGGCFHPRPFLPFMLTLCLTLHFARKKDFQRISSKALLFLVPGAGIEPAQPQGPRDFKSKNRETGKSCDIKDYLDFTGLFYYNPSW